MPLSSGDITVPPTVYGVAVGNVNPDVRNITFKGDDDKMRFVKLALKNDEDVEIGANLTKLNLAFDTKEGVQTPAKITLDLSQATALKELKIVGDLKNVKVKDANSQDVTLESLVNAAPGATKEITIGSKTFTFKNDNNVLSLVLSSGATKTP